MRNKRKSENKYYNIKLSPNILIITFNANALAIPIKSQMLQSEF